MTANRRIFWNVVATYGRTVYSIAIGLLSGRWVLMSLGEVDYGLMGVVGGLVGFVSFLNGLMAGAVGRFYAFSVGAAQKNPDVGLDECRKWFNTALTIHSVVPFVLVSIGYPIGVWAIENFLTIPINRVASCVWVWRFVCISSFVSMVSVPFNAMYTAKQEIAELTIYSFVTTTLNFCFLYYMVTHPAVWLTRFMAWTCFLAVAPQLVISFRAIIKYNECRFIGKYLWSTKRIKSVLSYAGSRFVCAISQIVSGQGVVILVNKMLGPARNAAMAIGSTVNGQCASLSSAIVGAYSPAITNAAGAGDLTRMRKLIYITCSSASAATMVFIIPLAIEISEVMRLWLKTPPVGSGTLCLVFMIITLLDRMSDGLWIGILAMGDIFAFQLFESLFWWVVLPLAYLLVKFGFDIVGVGIALVVAKSAAVVVKLVFSKKKCGISIVNWFKTVMSPVVLILSFTMMVGLLPRMYMEPSLTRVAATTLIVEMFLLPLLWRFLVPEETRILLLDRIRGRFRRS